MLTCYLVTTFFFTSHFYAVYGFVCHSLYLRYVFAIGTYLHRITSHRKWELQGTYIGATWDLPFSRSGSTCRANRQTRVNLLWWYMVFLTLNIWLFARICLFLHKILLYFKNLISIVSLKKNTMRKIKFSILLVVSVLTGGGLPLPNRLTLRLPITKKL